MIEPLEFTFEVATSVEHAFRTWTERMDRWWPSTHSESGDPDLTVVLEPCLGGRMYERTRDGTEYEWGRITLWDPPVRFGYSWHIRRPANESTEVLISFTELEPRRTRIRIQQSDWERVGPGAPQWRARNRTAWTSLFPHFIEYAEQR